MRDGEEGNERERSVTTEDLEVELAALRQEKSDLEDKYLRAAAALDNARKQAERIASARARERLQSLYVQLLEVVDNLDRALQYADEEDALTPGVRAVRTQLLDVLRREGVMLLEVEPGQPFDPQVHEAVAAEEGEAEENTIASVRQQGYSFDGQLLRPARVVVTRSPS